MTVKRQAYGQAIAAWNDGDLDRYLDCTALERADGKVRGDRLLSRHPRGNEVSTILRFDGERVVERYRSPTARPSSPSSPPS
jgi:hypothetical protein